MKLLTLAVGLALGTLPAAAISADNNAGHAGDQQQRNAFSFNRIASFPAFENTAIDEESVAEIVAAGNDGNTLIYTDAENHSLGFVDITDPAAPTALGLVELNGEPTSVAVKGGLALAVVNTSVDFINTSGELVVVDIATQNIIATHPLGGQPDSIATSKDGRYAAVVIENERDEDLGNGEPPQAPSGFLTIVDTVGAPATGPHAMSVSTVLPTCFRKMPSPSTSTSTRTMWRW